MATGYLKVKGSRIVDGEGNDVVLRGAAIGGWMNMVRGAFGLFQSRAGCLTHYYRRTLSLGIPVMRKSIVRR